ncbi:MAG TPA: Lrp/AsnC family transcriptional regulator [Acidimicrobiia bacterium]|nr:Lrp/AsnC family transcriptional regulator [Acidimicrobiia bacterium]
MKIDTTDKQIIALLQDDGRMPFSALGPKVGLSPAAARQRVLQLIDQGVMQIVAVTDPTTLGFHVQAMVGITVDGSVEAVTAEITGMPEVDYTVIVAGRFDMLVEVVAENAEHLISIMERIRAIPGVDGAEIFTYLRLAKQTYDWGTR